MICMVKPAAAAANSPHYSRSIMINERKVMVKKIVQSYHNIISV